MKLTVVHKDNTIFEFDSDTPSDVKESLSKLTYLQLALLDVNIRELLPLVIEEMTNRNIEFVRRYGVYNV